MLSYSFLIEYNVDVDEDSCTVCVSLFTVKARSKGHAIDIVSSLFSDSDIFLSATLMTDN